MDFFDWSKGCIYLRSYVDIVSTYTGCDVLEFRRIPVDSFVAITPESESGPASFSLLYQWGGAAGALLEKTS